MASFKTLVKQFVERKRNWSIGIYQGKSPFEIAPLTGQPNPVLTAKHVNDVPADFLADPFMLQKNDCWYMFFEVFNAQDQKGSIGLAKSFTGIQWTYEKIVLNEPFHLSYPYVFQHQDQYYMLPETFETRSVRLYRAIAFPENWVLEATLLSGFDYIDPSIFYFQNIWWLFTTTAENDALYLHYSDRLTDGWREHPASPVITENKQISRPAGRVIEYNGSLYRYAQDDEQVYGKQVRTFEITELTKETYAERESISHPVIQASGSGWNASGMHNIDPHEIRKNEWIACVDGYRFCLSPSSKVKNILRKFLDKTSLSGGSTFLENFLDH